MTRRLLGPVGGPVVFVLVAGLVFTGLGWVTVAALGVEEAQREAAARAEVAGNLRVALWRLDGRLLPVLGVENNRSFQEYAAPDPFSPYGPTCDPLLSGPLPDWMKLHCQLDQAQLDGAGWESPQVLTPDAAAVFRAAWPQLNLTNATPERAHALDVLRVKHPAKATFAAFGRGVFPSVDPVRRTAEAPRPMPPPAVDGIAGFAMPEAAPQQPDARRATEKEDARPKDAADVNTTPAPASAPPPRPAATPPPPPVALPPAEVATRGLESGDYGARGRATQLAESGRQSSTYIYPAPGMNPNLRNQNGGEQQLFHNGLALGRAPAPAPLADRDAAGNRMNKFDEKGGGTFAFGPSGGGGFGGGIGRTNDPAGKMEGSALGARAAREARAEKPRAEPTLGGLVDFLANAGKEQDKNAAGRFATNLKAKGADDQARVPDRMMRDPTDIRPVPSDAPAPGGIPVPTRGAAGGYGGAGVPAPKSAPAPPGLVLPAGPPAPAPKAASVGPTGVQMEKGPPPPAMPAAPPALHAQADPKATPTVAPAAAVPVPVAGMAVTAPKMNTTGTPAAATPAPPAPAGGGTPAGGPQLPTPAPTAPPVLVPAVPGPPAGEPAAGDNPGDNPAAPVIDPGPPPVAVHLGPVRPQWLAAADGTDDLLLVRTAKLDGRTVYQGVYLDWQRLKAVLLGDVKDLFPAADLVPVKGPGAGPPDRAMTALPVQLDPGPAAALPPAGWTPLRIGLALAWAAALIAFGAIGLAGWSLIDLSERRIRFVSAVTHELRTPLTSLRLYLDLLLSGMVQDDQKRTEYLSTLAVESDRLHRLVDNVLDFARLERRRSDADLKPAKVADVLAAVRDTWTDRCGTDGKELIVVSTLPPEAEVTTDAALVGQIVGNLIDNARKYTRAASDPRVWVWAKPEGRRVVLEVEDRGPGVPPRERSLIFRPFRRGAGADTTAGGAGLGLALCKQWAESLGGALTYRPADGETGACFRLELPAK